MPPKYSGCQRTGGDYIPGSTEPIFWIMKG